MSRIKGRYVAQVIIDIDIDGNMEGAKPYEEIKEAFDEELTSALEKLIKDEFDFEDCATVTVNELYKDMYQVPDDTEDNG